MYQPDQAIIHQQSQRQDILRLHLHQQSIKRFEVMQADPRQPCQPLRDVTAEVNLPEACPRNRYAQIILIESLVVLLFRSYV